jgi:Carboxypeptidase regulatory-like domain
MDIFKPQCVDSVLGLFPLASPEITLILRISAPCPGKESETWTYKTKCTFVNTYQALTFGFAFFAHFVQKINLSDPCLTYASIHLRLRAKRGCLMFRFYNRILLSISIVLIMLAGASVSRADVTGSIQGVVRDRSDAAVAGAHVTATNVRTNLQLEAISGADGSYRFLALPAGTYKLTVTANGFRPFAETDIVVNVNDRLTLDVTLNIGAVTEEVDVIANTVQVQTENTQLGDVIDSKKMLALPLNGRSYIDLLGLQAGVAPGTSESIQQDRPVSGTLNPGNISVNGQRETANAFLVNGGDVSESRNLGAGLVPNLDSIEEFRLITNSFDAEYGKFSGAIVNAITKSGTNSFHGDAFWFYRNNALDANDYYSNAAGLPTTQLNRNQFGAVGGGPAVKDRLFWFVDYQGTRQTQGAATTTSVPVADERQGNFDPTLLTGSVDGPAAGTGGAQSWSQVLSQRLGYPVVPGEPYSFAGCNSNVPGTGCVFPVNPTTGLAHIPGPTDPNNAWAAPAIGILPYIPPPTGPGIANNYTDNSQTNTWNDDKYGLKIDFINKTTGNWSFYYTIDNTTVFSALPFANVPGFPSNTPARAQQFVMSNAKNIGSTAVNEARFSFFRTALHKDNPAGSFASLSSLGFVTGAGTLGIIPSTTAGYPEYVPQIYFVNFNIGVPTLNTFEPNNTFMVSDTFSKVIGRHTLKFGGEFRYLQVNERNYASPNGNFVFDGSATGSDFADYLLGAPATSGGYTQAALQLLDSRTRYGGAFAQDTWKVTPNLTLNLGLRWEVSMPWYDTQGRIQTFNPGQQSTVFPLAPQGIVFPGDQGIPKTLAPTRYDNFGPRLGLAYSPGFTDGLLGAIFGGPGQSSIRAAFGMYYTSVEDLNLFYEVADAPFGLYWSTPTGVMFNEPFRVRTTGQSIGQRFPFTAPISGDPANKNLSFEPYLPFTYYPGYNIHNVLPVAEHFNLSYQRQLTKSTVLTLAYVGTEGHHLITQNEANPGNPALCQQLTAAGAVDASTGQPGCGPYNENDVFQLPSATVPCTTASPTPLPGCVYGTRSGILTPNYCPESTTLICYGSNNTNTLTTANSIYNSAQISVERKASDFTFLVAYTFAKGLDDSSAFNDLVNFVDPRLSRGLSSSDITHNFVASYVWALPFDRLFENGPKRLTQGWQIQGITRLSTGFPVQLNQGNGDLTLWGSSATDMPNRIGPVNTLNPRNANPDCPTADHTGCFFIPPDPNAPDPCVPTVGAFVQNCVPGTFGTANRRFFHGPGFNNTDFGLLKHTVIKENLAFDLRLEFFNIFNHTQFTNPGGNISGSTFGIITGTTLNPSGTRPPRIGQFSVKFYW